MGLRQRALILVFLVLTWGANRSSFGGGTHNGAQGAAEFFSRPDSLRVLRDRLAAEGYAGFPAAYQVVVRCASNDTLLLSAEYAAHRVIR